MVLSLAHAPVGDNAANNPLHTQVLEELGTMLQDEIISLGDDPSLDLDGIERTIQQLLRRVGGSLVETVVQLRCQQLEASPPPCPACQRPMELQHRSRRIEGTVGSYQLLRAAYRCRPCATSAVPVDAALGIGPGALSPGLSRIAALVAAMDPFAASSEAINEILGTRLTKSAVRRTAEALGMVAEQELAKDSSEPPPPSPIGPLVSNTLMISGDATTTFTDGDWHEVKVGMVAPLGPKTKTDPDTDGDSLCIGPASYCACVGSADTFFDRLKPLVHQAGFGHDGLDTVVKIADGGPWIWNRMSEFNRPGVQSVEILDYIHACSHVWKMAEAVYGRDTLAIHAWAEPLTLALKEKGPAKLLAALDDLQPRSDEARDALRKAREYFKAHAAAGRMDYPRFRANGWPIGSGSIESACKQVVCMRTKSSGMRWRKLGAQSILNLRCLRLSPGHWEAFFRRQPQRRRTQATRAQTAAHAA